MESVSTGAVHLSQAAQKFLDYVTCDPERMRPLRHLAPQEYFAPLQSWPTFIAGEKLAEVRRATVDLTRLVRSIPERIFGNDPRKIAGYYGIRDEAMVAILLDPPSGLEAVLVRNDYIDTDDGLKCLEVNAGMVGGWQHRFFEQRVLAHPMISRFIQQEGIRPVHRDPLVELMQFIIDHNRGKATTASGVLNVAIAINSGTPPPGEDARLSRMYRGLLEENGTGLQGEVVLCSSADLSDRENLIWHRGRLPIQALVQMSDEPLPRAAFRCFKAGRLSLYSGPVSVLLNDKRILALLSERVESDLFTADERDVLERHLPWTRAVARGRASYRGVAGEVPDLLIEHRENFVVKPSFGFQGRGVTFGGSTPPDQWARLVTDAVAQGGWLAQEKVESRPYVYQSGEQGYGMFDVAWGTFCFGDRYGGGFLRMLPRGQGDGVINSARGATEGVLFEV